MNLARLNHILIPPTKAGRDRFRRGLVGKLAAPGMAFYSALSSEGRVLAVVTLLLGAASLDIYRTRLYLLWSALCGLFVAALLVRRAFRLRAVRIEVRVPPRVTVGAITSCEILLHNEGTKDHRALRLAVPFLPWDGRWVDVPAGQPLLPAGGRARLVARATFTDRGHHHLDPFSVMALVPLGLAVGPPLASRGSRFRVVPRIANVSSVELPACGRYHPGGVARASMLGESRELCGVRPYRRGDPVRDLHALTWARTGVAHVREYQQEYYRRVAVVVDVDRAVTSERGLEALLSLAAGMVARLSAGEALVDLVVADDATPTVTVGRSIGSVDQALDHLAMVRRTHGFDVDRLFTRLGPSLEQLSALYLLTEQADEAHGSAALDWLMPRRRRGRDAAARLRGDFLDECERRGICTRRLRVARRVPPSDSAVGDSRAFAFTEVERQEPLRT